MIVWSHGYFYSTFKFSTGDLGNKIGQIYIEISGWVLGTAALLWVRVRVTEGA